MIKQLQIKNYILIDELTCNFNDGLNVITGETGAGKSIIINAIDLAFSSRVSKEVIKSGCDRAVIEIIIENRNNEVKDFFEKNGIDYYGNEIVLSKEISQNSVKSRVNGTLVNNDVIKYLKNIFLDIHSQHQTYAFLQPKYHIVLLDEYAKNFYGDKLANYKIEYNEYLDLGNQLEKLKNSATMTQSQIDFLKFQINEINSAEISSENEDEDLKNEIEILENAEKLKELTGSAYWALNGDDSSILDALIKVKQNITKAYETDGKLSDIKQILIDSVENLKVAASNLRDYSQSMENDTQRLNEIQERLFLLDKLKSKYGLTLKDVIESGKDFEKDLGEIEFSTQNIENIEKQIKEKHEKLEQIASEISEGRKNYAKVLSELIREKLEKLELPKVKFLISVKTAELSVDGCDDVEFLISTNVSEDLKPLIKVASGGEISRVMLAIKSVFANSDNIDTVIFDEIDTGVSGKTSQSVADEILDLSKLHQVILITHQAIIASKADKHFYVRKSQSDETKVEVYVLTGDNRIMALAELAGGEITDTSIEFAKSLVNT